MTVTSLLDGTHNPGSLHPKGFAADIRTRDLNPQQVQLFYADLYTYLDKHGYDIVMESVGSTPDTTAQHVHVEYDPHPGDVLPGQSEET